MENGDPGYKWGNEGKCYIYSPYNEGKCYIYSPDNEGSKKNAIKKATLQGLVIGDIKTSKDK
jgi:hypothetical protein